MQRKPFLLRFNDFWPNNQRAIENFFIPLISRIVEGDIVVVKSNSVHVDLEVISVYPQKKSWLSVPFNQRISRKFSRTNNYVIKKDIRRANRIFWYSGENIRPPLHLEYDAYLCYDTEAYAKNVVYLPIWVLNLNWFGLPSPHGFISAYNKIEDLVNFRSLTPNDLSNRRFCCIFANHLNEMRNGTIHVLSELGEVDVFGYSGRISPKDKKAMASKYKFILCPENNLYPGYVTEKLLEGYQTTAFPIYWGQDIKSYFNSKSHLNLATNGGLSASMSILSELISDEKLYLDRLNSPLLNSQFNLDSLINKLRSFL